MAEKESQSAKILESFGFRLAKAHQALRCAWEDQLAPLSLTPAQAIVLRSVLERPGSGPREVARHLVTDPMNAKRLLDYLEANGYLAFESSPGDRRRKCAHLTQVGEELALEVVRRSRYLSSWVEDLLGPQNYASVAQSLDEITAAMQPNPTERLVSQF